MYGVKYYGYPELIDINICFPLLSNNTTFNFLRFLQRSSVKIRCYESNVITNDSICLNPPIKKMFTQHQLLIAEKIVSSIAVNLYKVPSINLILANNTADYVMLNFLISMIVEPYYAQRRVMSNWSRHTSCSTRQPYDIYKDILRTFGICSLFKVERIRSKG